MYAIGVSDAYEHEVLSKLPFLSLCNEGLAHPSILEVGGVLHHFTTRAVCDARLRTPPHVAICQCRNEDAIGKGLTFLVLLKTLTTFIATLAQHIFGNDQKKDGDKSQSDKKKSDKKKQGDREQQDQRKQKTKGQVPSLTS